MRPTIALCLIAKNEAHNLGPLLSSVKGCFDEIHITDTGSTDNTLQFIENINKAKWQGMPEIKVHHFEWINDFSAARNYSFSHTNADYVMWLDCDDSLVNPEAFIEWRDTVMHSAHYWVALYNYAFSQDGRVECQFIRERVIKNNFGFQWRYFVHEGIVQTENKHYWPNKANSWWVDHRRTDEDRKADHMRNIRLFEAHADKGELEPRMKFYYGKELFENGFQEKAGGPLLEALKDPRLEPHDRVLTFQYAAQSAAHAKAWPQAIEICMGGLIAYPTRAELWCVLGDVHANTGNVAAARLAYKNALNCQPDTMGGIVVTFQPAYHDYPHMQLATLSTNVGDFDGAWRSIEALKSVGYPQVAQVEAHYHQMRELSVVRSGLPKADDIIITCPPVGAVTDWDENTLASKGHGGSEAAAIEVARLLREKTGRPVKVFQPRAKREVMPSGVEYIPVQELQGYIQNVEPAVHIAWRHSVRLTRAPSFVWCHDLLCPGADRVDSYDKIFALSGFHRDYLHQCMRIPKEKITLLFNGINPDDFKEPAEKNPLKVIFSSSPDRGLDRAIRIVEKAREVSGLNIELHSFYGFENMKKGGLKDMAEKIEGMIAARPWVNHHGFVNKRELVRHFKESSVWVYPANFIETYCITAIEALAAGTWPIVRDMGALKYTMREAIEKGMCEVIQTDCESEAEVGIWANRVISAILDEKWRYVRINPEDYTWGKVAEAMLEVFGLAKEQAA